MDRIYLDHNATTPLCEEAAEAMWPWLRGRVGNASSLHAEGRAAREAVETARARVAELVGAKAENVVFTSGGTEADNLALLVAARESRGRLLLSRLEHPAVSEAAERLRARGTEVVTLACQDDGALLEEVVREALAGGATLVSVQAANHEIGIVQPIGALAAAAHAAGALFHTDAVQGAGKVEGLEHADLVSLSSHKLYGPTGVGALVGPAVRDRLEPLLAGGHQERGRRPGTEAVAAVVGFGEACARFRREGAAREAQVRGLRDRLERSVLGVPGARLFGPADGARRVAGTLCVGFDGADGQLVAASLDLEGVAVSTGAACTSGSIEPSRVLVALGVPAKVARTAVRFSLGWGTTETEITTVAELLPGLVARVRAAGV
jgi:cysteine desulfurase